MVAASRVEQAYLAACLAELTALKPGNVHAYAAGHRMTVADFEASARASAPVIAAPDLTVGERILRASRLTRDAVTANTNLGILLLCAPLAQAALRSTGRDLRQGLQAVLEALTVGDAVNAYAAIRLANPGGLGASPRHDVREPPQVTLLEAMRVASDRDRVAAQYITGFADVFELGLDRLTAGRQRWHEFEWAVSSTYLGFLGEFPDSHIQRKFGLETAEAVRLEARKFDTLLSGTADPRVILHDLRMFDSALKDKDINPGTSADLTVAALFVSNLQ
ncbi:MAG: triphosphoribosyl-dephospho-CoA synthase [Dongiaceae bacterium]